MQKRNSKRDFTDKCLQYQMKHYSLYAIHHSVVRVSQRKVQLEPLTEVNLWTNKPQSDCSTVVCYVDYGSGGSGLKFRGLLYTTLKILTGVLTGLRRKPSDMSFERTFSLDHLRPYARNIFSRKGRKTEIFIIYFTIPLLKGSSYILIHFDHLLLYKCVCKLK